ncbi:MAG: RluA family pseudouridine synthase, partial [Clostridia bacterium]|nr:RluA family pseudouridine synthase [Clostridia bacterium]
MAEIKLVVPPLYDGQRIDIFVALLTDITRSRIKNLAEDGCLFANGKCEKVRYKVKVGDEITLIVPENKETTVKPNADIELDIVYQDNDLAVINKQQGLTVHAGNGTGDETLVNALLSKLDNLSGINGEVRPGIVHRIDKNTSGLLVVAKNDKAHVFLSKQIEEKQCKRIYIALLEGVVKTDSGRIETFIRRDEKNRVKMAVTKFGRVAITDYKVIKRYKNHTLCEFSLLTGRTHQIRVHAKHMGHPVVGDPEYGFKNQKFN